MTTRDWVNVSNPEQNLQKCCLHGLFPDISHETADGEMKLHDDT